MRKLVLVTVVLLLVAPTLAGAERTTPSDGCLVVRDGQGVVSIVARGGIRGRFDSGRILVDEAVGSEGVEVFGAARIRELGPRTTVYIGERIRFQAIDGPFRIRIVAVGIDLSSVSRGFALVSGEGFSDPGEFSVDRASFCETGFRTLPSAPTRVTLGTPPPISIPGGGGGPVGK
jgi:hypothetical protein